MAKKQAPKSPRLVCAQCNEPVKTETVGHACPCGSVVFRAEDADLARVRAVRHAEDWLERSRLAKERSTGDYRRFLAQEYQAAYGEPMPAVSLDLVWRKLAYRIQAEGWRQEGLAVPEKVGQNQVVAERLSGEGFTYDDVLRAQARAARSAQQGGRTMAKKNDTQATEGPRRTIQVLCSELFAAKTGSPEAMIAAVKKEFPESAFKENHVTFYAAKYRKGELSGQDATQRTIAWLPGRGEKKAEAPAEAAPAKKGKAAKAEAPAPAEPKKGKKAKAA